MNKLKKSIFLSLWVYSLISCLLVILIFFLSHHPKNNFKDEKYQCFVKRVIDGDTLVAICNDFSSKPLKIRLSDIDAPEISQSIWGEKSSLFLRQLIARAKNKVGIYFNGTDVFNRSLGVIMIAEKDINYLMVKKGMAVVYSRYHPPKNYLQAMQSAKNKKLGIWSQSGLQQNPQRYRRLAH